MRISIVIAGPTASGKTAVAAELACLLNGEIVSADSRQVYRHLDTGTNKAGEWDPATKLRYVHGIPQHLTDLIEPSESFSAGEFARRANEVIVRLHASGKTPLITGGTGLYIKALIDGLAPLPERDAAIRKELTRKAQQFGKEYLYRRLKDADPAAAEKNRGNPQRLIRAIEVFELTGKPLSRWHAETKPSGGTFVQFGLAWDREELYRTIDRRSKEMLSSGMIEETRKVLAMGFPAGCPGLQSLGYRAVTEYLEGKITHDGLERSLRVDTRHYAKRQITWFKRDPRIAWIPVQETTFQPKRIANGIFRTISNMI